MDSGLAEMYGRLGAASDGHYEARAMEACERAHRHDHATGYGRQMAAMAVGEAQVFATLHLAAMAAQARA